MKLLKRVGSVVRLILMGIGALYVLVSFTPLAQSWAQWLSGTWNTNEGDVLVVLNGSPQVEDLIGSETYWRAIYAIRAMREQSYKRVLFVGAGTTPAAIRRFVASHGLPLDKLEFETASGSTHQNAEFAAAMLKGERGKIVLLTSDYHSRRAEWCFAKAGVTVSTYPAPDVLKVTSSWYRRWSVLPTLVMETAKLAYYWYKNWI